VNILIDELLTYINLLLSLSVIHPFNEQSENFLIGFHCISEICIN